MKSGATTAIASRSTCTLMVVWNARSAEKLQRAWPASGATLHLLGNVHGLFSVRQLHKRPLRLREYASFATAPRPLRPSASSAVDFQSQPLRKTRKGVPQDSSDSHPHRPRRRAVKGVIGSAALLRYWCCSQPAGAALTQSPACALGPRQQHAARILRIAR